MTAIQRSVRKCSAGSAAIAIRRADIVSALLKDLQRSDLSEEDHQTALAALAAQAAFADSDAALRDALKPAIPLLAKALDSPKTEVRGAAVRALGHIGGEARPAMETLRKLADHDPQTSVRKDAARAIKAVEGTAKMPTVTVEQGSSGRLAF